MSSIYKKGRDGYYYYQTYVYNPDSKKKDKRVFHALRTKDLVAAKSKQRELDMQYENKSDIDSNSIQPSYNLNPKLIIAIILATIATTIVVVNFIRTNRVKQNPNVSIASKEVNRLEDNIYVEPNVEPVKPVMKNQIDSMIGDIPKNLKTYLGPKVAETKVIIPKYSLY